MDEMQHLNRSAVIVIPRKPFLDWLHFVDPTDAKVTMADMAEDPAVYLLPPCEDDKEFDERLRNAYSAIFEEELNSWWTKESDWPTHRSFELFRQWFDCRFCSELIDLCADPLED